MIFYSRRNFASIFLTFVESFVSFLVFTIIKLANTIYNGHFLDSNSETFLMEITCYPSHSSVLNIIGIIDNNYIMDCKVLTVYCFMLWLHNGNNMKFNIEIWAFWSLLKRFHLIVAPIVGTPRFVHHHSIFQTALDTSPNTWLFGSVQN